MKLRIFPPPFPLAEKAARMAGRVVDGALFWTIPDELSKRLCVTRRARARAGGARDASLSRCVASLSLPRFRPPPPPPPPPKSAPCDAESSQAAEDDASFDSEEAILVNGESLSFEERGSEREGRGESSAPTGCPPGSNRLSPASRRRSKTPEARRPPPPPHPPAPVGR